MSECGSLVAMLQQVTEEAVALAATEDRSVDLQLTLLGVQVRVTGTSVTTEQSYTAIHILRWDRLEQDVDPMGAIVEAVASGMATVTERLKTLR